MIAWTNASVIAFADGADPVKKIQNVARDLVLKAMEAGWHGPPYNPIDIASLMDVPVEPSFDIADARTLMRQERPVIEFNPSQPRERVRFSIAHEMAHLLFSDVLEETRHRGNVHFSGDNWQLEMLCNLAASEFVMPIGSLQLGKQTPSIEEMMITRRSYDVSAEAFMIRIAKTSNKPIGVFCASPQEHSEEGWSYGVDYFIPSPLAPSPKIQGSIVPRDSAAYRCTAIGYTDSGTEKWITGTPLRVEYVGVPAYPGVPMPRAIGLVYFDAARPGHRPIRYVHGDALEPRGEGVKVFCQLVNDRARKWGGGIARQTARKHPVSEYEFANWITEISPGERLGQVHFTSPTKGLFVSSLVAQAGFGPTKKPRIQYRALKTALARVATFASKENASVHMPRIGTGAAGGNWNTIKDMVEEIFTGSGLEVIIYDLPPKREQFWLF